MGTLYEKVILEGNAKTRGRQYGKVARDKIKKSIALYKKLFMAYSGMEWSTCKKKAELFLPSIQEYFQPGIEEMEGIAETAGVDFEDILVLNCRSEMMFNIIDGCTSIGVTSDVTPDGRPYLAQTWDWIEPCRDISIVLEIRQPSLPTILTIAEAGMIGGKGLNSAGLGVCLNALSCLGMGIGVPLHVLYRGILNSWKIPDAVESVVLPKKAGTGCFLIGSASDQVMCLEYVPDNYDIIYADDGWVAHTNHYLSPLLAHRDMMKMKSGSTFSRLGRVRRLIKKNIGMLDIPVLHKVLSDHADYPDSICSHLDPRDEEMMRDCSVYATFMDLTQKSLHVTNSYPCQGELYSFTLLPDH